MNVTTTASGGTIGGYYAQINLSNDEIAKNAKVIIPIGGCLSDGRGGYAAIASPYSKDFSLKNCKIWTINSATADTYLISFLCLS